MKITPGPGFSLNPDTDPDTQLRRYVDEGRRQTALELAVQHSSLWVSTFSQDEVERSADQVVSVAARFEAFIRDGQPSATRDTPTASLIDFLACVHDLDIRTRDGKLSVYDKQGGHTVSTLPLSFARAAEQAGLVIEYASGRWGITGRGRETLDRGQV